MQIRNIEKLTFDPLFLHIVCPKIFVYTACSHFYGEKFRCQFVNEIVDPDASPCVGLSLFMALINAAKIRYVNSREKKIQTKEAAKKHVLSKHNKKIKRQVSDNCYDYFKW